MPSFILSSSSSSLYSLFLSPTSPSIFCLLSSFILPYLLSSLTFSSCLLSSLTFSPLSSFISCLLPFCCPLISCLPSPCLPLSPARPSVRQQTSIYVEIPCPRGSCNCYYSYQELESQHRLNTRLQRTYLSYSTSLDIGSSPFFLSYSPAWPPHLLPLPRLLHHCSPCSSLFLPHLLPLPCLFIYSPCSHCSSLFLPHLLPLPCLLPHCSSLPYSLPPHLLPLLPLVPHCHPPGSSSLRPSLFLTAILLAPPPYCPPCSSLPSLLLTARLLAPSRYGPSYPPARPSQVSQVQCQNKHQQRSPPVPTCPKHRIIENVNQFS